MTSQKGMMCIAALGLLAFVCHAAMGSDADDDRTTTHAITVNASGDNAAALSDFDGDRTVGSSDFVLFAGVFGARRGDEKYEAKYDLNGDGEIGFSDFVVFAQNFGKEVPVPVVLRPTGELQPWDLSPIVPIDSVRSMPTGMPVFMRTEFANGELADLEMRFIQVVDDFLPPMPVYMVEASDPVLIQLGGIAKGMSGSPIFTEQGTWGAIAYGFISQDNPPYYFFATPIEWVIGSKGTVPLAKPAATLQGSRIVPLDIPVLSTGFNRMSPPEGGSSLLSEVVAAGLTRQRQHSFAPGRPLVVGLLLGELTLGGLGTISYVDGDRIYGFGHGMWDVGPVALPIIEAQVLGEISNLEAPYKFAALNPTVRGTLTEDRLPGVRGMLDDGPELVPIRNVYTFPSGGVVELVHKMPTIGVDPSTSLDLVAGALFAPLSNRVEDEPDHSIRVTTDISFVGADSTLARSRLYASPEGRLVSLIEYASNALSFILAQLMTRDDYALQVREAEVQVEVIPEPRFALVVDVAADTVISLGDMLAVTASLRVGRRSDREIELALSVPDTFPAGVYQLEAGSVATLGDDSGGAGGPGFGPPGGFRGEETIEDAFARLNKADENVLLKARLSYVMPLEPGRGFPRGQGPEATVSTQEDVDLFIEGFKSLQIKVGGD